MATTVILKTAQKDPDPSTIWRVRFGDGSEREFATFAALVADAQMPDLDKDLTQRLCLAYALGRSADLSNINPVKDKQFIFDLTNNSPIRLV